MPTLPLVWTLEPQFTGKIPNPGTAKCFKCKIEPRCWCLFCIQPTQTLQSGAPGVLKEMYMLWTVFVVLLLLWILGFSFHIAGSLIHLVLVIAVVVLIIQLITGRRAL
jgi:hypothetical protein